MSGSIVALGGGGFSVGGGALDAFVLSLARTPRPSVCFVPTASGDAAGYVLDFYRAFSALDCEPIDLALFERRVRDLRAFVLAQDVIYVGGGSTANLLAVWRVHGLDAILREALDAGAVLAGVSAGMNCWFEACVTDSFDLDGLAPLHDGLGFLAGSACPHYDGEPQRRPTYRRLVAEGFPAGWAADDGAALHFRAGELVEVVAEREGAGAWWVSAEGEAALPARLPNVNGGG